MKSLHLLAACVLAAAPSAFAGTLTFENAPQGQDLGGYFQGVTFGPDAQVVTTSTSFPAHSGVLELTDANIANPTITMTFSSPSTDVSFWYTTAFGFTAQAFDKNGASLGFLNGNPNVNLTTLVGTDSFADFGFGNIASVVITDSGGLGNFLTIDDLTADSITGNPVPEATSTLALFGAAALGLLAFRRKLAVQ